MEVEGKKMKKYLNFVFMVALFLLIGFFAPAFIKGQGLNPAITVIFGLIALMFIAGFFFVIKDTKEGKGIFGLNFEKGICPRCKKDNSKIFRFPKTVGEIFKGEWTCVFCGCKVDHWNKELGKNKERGVDRGRTT